MYCTLVFFRRPRSRQNIFTARWLLPQRNDRGVNYKPCAWVWNPGKCPSYCTGLLKMCNFVWISSAILVDWAVFRIFRNFRKMWTRWNFESIFLEIFHQKGLFGAIERNSNFPTCRRLFKLQKFRFKASLPIFISISYTPLNITLLLLGQNFENWVARFKATSSN